MNQANQKVVIQSANMTLIQIRQYEIGYFQIFFSNFGTQAALMIGFIAGSISQVPGWDNPTNCPYFFLVLYWITSAICLCAGMHCLVCTVFINVYGQGLALRGPPGSMVRAIQGLIAEQEQILIAFCVAIVSFGFQCIGMYFIMMDGTSAIVTSIITGFCMILWYRYALRLYNRFSWSGINVDWNDDHSANPTETLDELNPTVVNDLHATTSKYHETGKKSMKDFQPVKKRQSSISKTGNTASDGSKPPTSIKAVDISDSVSIIDGAEYYIGNNQSAHKSDEIQSVITTATSQQDIIELTKSMSFGSYLSMKERGRLGGESWVRRYFIIKGHHIFYYQDKRHFELNPAKPINQRAIDLEGYTLVAGSVEPPYPISLVPYDAEDNRKVWKFRCDTSGEFERWIQLFSLALQHCNPDKQQGELVVMTDGKTEVVSVFGDQTHFSSTDER